MQPHELKPLKKRLTAMQLADRERRIEQRRQTFRYQKPVIAPLRSWKGGMRFSAANRLMAAFYGLR